MELDEHLNQLNKDLERKLGNLYHTNCPKQSDTDDIKSEDEEFHFCPECGTRLTEDAKYCMNCGYKIKLSNDEKENDVFDDKEDCEQYGIIFTDTEILAEKYGIGRGEVEDLLSNFIEDNGNHGYDLLMLDMANHQQKLGEGTWMDYSEALQLFMQEKNIKPSPHNSLFIIGGDDVIPQPCEENPCASPDPSPYDEFVHADFYYCFYGKLPLEFLDYSKARCNVSRLPLEDGELSTAIGDDLQAYFNISNQALEDGGISVGKAVMTSNKDWIPASREMSRNLPMELLKDENDVVLDNMYISPDVKVDMPENLKEKYFESLSEADMLVFNLHGSYAPEDSGFYSTDLAFSIDMLSKSNARIFNTVACWGARYIHYHRKDSMLLSAMYGNGVLLYAGSCVPSMGKCGCFQSDETWRIQPAAYSESFMGRFAEYQCIGSLPAGEAFLKAKCDYYNLSRTIEDDEVILATVLMFNLYGNPMLRTKPNIEVLGNLQPTDGSKMVRMPFRKMNRKVIMRNEGKKGNYRGSVIEQIQGAVDSNLRCIHEGLTTYLYHALGLRPRELYCVESYSTTNVKSDSEKGYLYNYRKSYNGIISQFSVKVDANGKLIEAIQTK